ncbi:hypothetical protein MLD38_025496 [Melastoma candidum]|uniref:Uncharacterized protein n=1 Tax=Melastoma candidum TaxID=119954 RepID=A0ACB9NX61_9MYRT|nr:hypothetical protein MLD38_025496 [Melastoma candidum]
MKFMKLGSRPDAFYTTQAIRCISSEVSSDLIIQVRSSKYLLHKFPLFSKCLRLQRIFSDVSSCSSPDQPVHLPDFPGGEEAFELCAKFCYGITITLSAYNVVAARCAAAYLQMTEDIEKGNLIHKVEVFFSSCILRGWRDSIVALKSTTAFSSLAEDVRITGRCIEAIATKVLMNPSKVSLSQSRSVNIPDDVSSNGLEIQSQKTHTVAKGWWAEDIAELSIDLYLRTIIAIKSGGKVPPNLIGDALRIYVSCWLPKVKRARRMDEGISSESDSDGKVEPTLKDRALLESIIGQLPTERGAVSCSFLSKLLKAANILDASPSSKKQLARLFGIQLEDATVKDLLIPPLSVSHACKMLYDVDIVMSIVEMFMLHGQSPPTSPPRLRTEFVDRRRSRSAENVDLELQESSRRGSSASHSSKLKVAKIVDGYLQEIGSDTNLPMSKFISLAEMVTDFARTDHDDLYKAIDIYLKAHPDLTKCERKKLCRILDCRKLSMESCIHAAKNENLPLRVIVQVLFFEHARVTKSGDEASHLPDDLKGLLSQQGIDLSRPQEPLTTMPTSIPAEDQFCVSAKRTPLLKVKLAEDKEQDVQHSDTGKVESGKGLMKTRRFCAIPGRPGRMLSKFWSNNRRASNVKATAKS